MDCGAGNPADGTVLQRAPLVKLYRRLPGAWPGRGKKQLSLAVLHIMRLPTWVQVENDSNKLQRNQVENEC